MGTRQDRSSYQVRNRKERASQAPRGSSAAAAPGSARGEGGAQRSHTRAQADASSYDRSRYRARNADAQPQRSSLEGGSRGYSARSSRQSRAPQQPARRREPARSRRGAEYPAAQEARSSRQRAQHSPQRGARGAHSAAPALPAVPLPALLALGLIALAVLAFGLSRCMGGAVQEQPAGQEPASAAPAFELPAQLTEEDFLPTPYIASCDDVMLHSAVRADQLTEVLIHNASYSYAQPLKTKLPESTNVDVIAQHGTGRVATEQPTGDAWLTGEFIRCFRSASEGPKMSAIDCGGPVGATVYAPVSGTVVKVQEYDLYNNPSYPDVQIHIQPQGRPDLDVVLIHLTDISCAEGDTVVGGATPIATIRDVYAYIGEEMQLKDYTALGDNGNHTHIQVNDVNNKEYHGLD